MKDLTDPFSSLARLPLDVRQRIEEVCVDFETGLRGNASSTTSSYPDMHVDMPRMKFWRVKACRPELRSTAHLSEVIATG